MSAVVVTGASGFVGRAVVAELRRRGVTVAAVSRQSLAGGVTVADYADAPGGDVLVHLAEPSDRAAARKLGADHVHRTALTLQTLLAKGYGKTVYASSAVVYEDDSPSPRRVGDPTPTDDPYARAKRRCESEVSAAGGAVARLANLFGPGMASSNAISTILAQIPGEGAVEVWDDEPVRDFLWVDDAAEAIASMALSSEKGIFNVGSGEGNSIGAVARTALAIAGDEARPVVATKPSGRRSHLVLDIEDTRRRLGWTPRTSLADGLRQLIGKREKGRA
ncbi:NAD(P)-dependent oxidoreductase [Pelagibius sp. 7325]|uniref:NAD-dependent epimerase/dehydratase family protein n=1 Tax=Pelagibius sp. 7325 TaxID=3131994 RepID=UPI0030EB2766